MRIRYRIATRLTSSMLRLPRTISPLFLIALILLVPASSTVALSQDQLNIFDSGINYYDLNSGSQACSTSGLAGSSSVKLLMEAIAMHESGGDPKAQNPGTSASGKYQIFDSTWQGLAKRYYPPAQQFARAYEAPEYVQDAVVYLAFGYQAIKQYNAFQIAVGWYGGSPIINQIPKLFNTVPAGNTQSYGQYGNEIVDFMLAGKAEDSIATKYGDSPRYGNTPLSKIQINPESAPDFNTYLTKLGKAVPELRVVEYSSNGQPIDSTAPSAVGQAVAAPVAGCGTPAGNFVFYTQNDPQWANHLIYTGNVCGGAPDDIGCAGCGPTSVAMVVASLADSSVTPVDTGDYMTKVHGYSADGATVDGLTKALEHWGLKTQQLGTSFDAAISVIKNGGLVIAGGHISSPYSADGHVVVLRGLDSSGNFLIGNPAPWLQNSQDQGFSAADLGADTIYMIGVTK
jgi:hypothetical protein